MILICDSKGVTTPLQQVVNNEQMSIMGFFSKVKNAFKSVLKAAAKTLKVVVSPFVVLYEMTVKAIEAIVDFCKSAYKWFKRNLVLILIIIAIVAIVYFCAGAVAAASVEGASGWYVSIGNGLTAFGGWLSESYATLTSIIGLAWSNMKKGVSSAMEYYKDNSDLINGAASYGLAAWGAYEIADKVKDVTGDLLSNPWLWGIAIALLILWLMKNGSKSHESTVVHNEKRIIEYKPRGYDDYGLQV